MSKFAMFSVNAQPAADDEVFAGQFPLRPEAVWDQFVPMYDASTLKVREKLLKGYCLVPVRDVLKKPSVVLAFGVPNLSLYLPGESDNLNSQVVLDRVSIKSLWREPTEYLYDASMIQSGIWVVLHDVPDDTLDLLRRGGQELATQGVRFRTCVNGTCRLLARAGFSLGEGTAVGLEDRYHPMRLFLALVHDGLFLNGEQVKFSIVRTAPDNPEFFFRGVVLSELNTLVRHGKRLLPEGMRSEAKGRNEKRAPRRAAAPMLPASDQYVSDLTLSISQPTPWARWLRLFWGSHSIYKIAIPERVHLEDYLTKNHVPFENSKKNLWSFLKERFLFSRWAVALYQRILFDRFVTWENVPENWLYEILLPDDVYNYVITDKEIIIARVRVAFKPADAGLSKHLLISGYDQFPGCGGEVQKVVQEPNGHRAGALVVNRSSGTLVPSEETLHQAVALIKAVVPNLPIEADTVI